MFTIKVPSEIKQLNLCRSCNSAGCTGCCEDYNRNNRYKKFSIMNMKMNDTHDNDYSVE